jgi:hypothetical protein
MRGHNGMFVINKKYSLKFSRADNRMEMWRFSDVSVAMSQSLGCASGLLEPTLMTESSFGDTVLGTSENLHILTRLSALENFI